jgi:hypothetical protein
MKHMEPEPYDCAECSYSVNDVKPSMSQHRLWTHFLSHHAFSASAQRQRTRRHQIQQASSLRRKFRGACDQCDARFITKHGMVLHMCQVHRLLTPFIKPTYRVQCDDCHKLVFHRIALVSHWRVAHSLPNQPLVCLPPPQVKRRFACDDCDFRGIRRAFWSHWARKHSALTFARLRKLLKTWKTSARLTCDHCPAILASGAGMAIHLSSRHGQALDVVRQSGQPRLGACDDCGAPTQTRRLYAHWGRCHADQ